MKWIITGGDPYFILSRHLYHPNAKLLARIQELVFDRVPLSRRTMLDVGGGSGLMSFFAATHGARRVVCLEPAEAGSNPQMDETFLKWQVGLGEDVHVDLVRSRFQDYDTDEKFGVVLLHSSINHLDEEACKALPSWAAEDAYFAIFDRLAELTEPGGDLIITDAARKNMWGRMGLRSPFARSIDWEVHAQPERWVKFAERAGFSTPRVMWRAHARLGRVGQAVLGNRLGGWMTNSMFVIQMRRAA